MIEHERQDDRRNDEKFDSESVMLSIVGGLELDVHQVESAERRRQIEDFHGRVVQRDKMGEQVQVTSKKYERE